MKSLKHQFADWVSKQDPEAAYNYSSIFDCALCQFLQAKGYPVRTVGGVRWTDTSGNSHRIPKVVAETLFNGGEGHTFGALAERLSALGEPVGRSQPLPAARPRGSQYA